MHDLIEQIEDARLRERLRQEWEASVREKKWLYAISSGT